jgi:hypothetical protein
MPVDNAGHNAVEEAMRGMYRRMTPAHLYGRAYRALGGHADHQIASKGAFALVDYILGIDTGVPHPTVHAIEHLLRGRVE